ncbi:MULTISPECIES: LysR family transcriptional regulator [Polaromonas]|uniref:LysR family transcriptional regulator n=1 Tax=Polaromonas aquatica TaxID=332657 RepID=A0ABW1TY69_9BURK
MQVFVRVVQHGSLSSAARQLDTSPASVSRQIKALEDTLGARLLNRTSRKLTLTEAGETYFHHAEQILHQFDEAHHSVSQLQHSPRGTLRVHSRILVGQLFLVPAITKFLLTHSEIKIDLMLSNHSVDLVEQNIDVDIRIGKLSDSSLIARQLAVSERIVCAAPAYLQSHPPIQGPHDLVHHNCLTYRLNMGSVEWRFLDPQGQTTDVAVSGSLRTDYGPALRDATLAGLGLSLMPDWSVREDIRRGDLVRLFPAYKVCFLEFENGVYALYQRSRHTSAKVRLFVDHLIQTFEPKPGG